MHVPPLLVLLIYLQCPWACSGDEYYETLLPLPHYSTSPHRDVLLLTYLLTLCHTLLAYKKATSGWSVASPATKVGLGISWVGISFL